MEACIPTYEDTYMWEPLFYVLVTLLTSIPAWARSFMSLFYVAVTEYLLHPGQSAKME